MCWDKPHISVPADKNKVKTDKKLLKKSSKSWAEDQRLVTLIFNLSCNMVFKIFLLLILWYFVYQPAENRRVPTLQESQPIANLASWNHVGLSVPWPYRWWISSNAGNFSFLSHGQKGCCWQLAPKTGRRQWRPKGQLSSLNLCAINCEPYIGHWRK